MKTDSGCSLEDVLQHIIYDQHGRLKIMCLHKSKSFCSKATVATNTLFMDISLQYANIMLKNDDIWMSSYVNLVPITHKKFKWNKTFNRDGRNSAQQCDKKVWRVSIREEKNRR